MARKPDKRTDPVSNTVRDISVLKLVISWNRVFWRVYKLSGLSSALRVFPILWTIVWAVRGFSCYHREEYERLVLAHKSGVDLEEAVLTQAQYEKYRKLGAWLCRRLHHLGPTFIKIGQTLSTRADLLPLPAMLELYRLQEEVEPFATACARQIIFRELGGYPEALYRTFDNEPIAAASLSQAYRAQTFDGRDVVVKVQRPDLPLILTKDIEILRTVADEVMRYPSLCRHTDWPSVVEEFARTTYDEIDYIKEGRNADKFRHNFRNFERICIPRIIWKLTGRRVLTIEYVPGVRLTDLETIDALKISRDELTHIGATFYLRQLLEDGFFHADPHPGNLRVMPDGRIGIFDFGMVGKLGPGLKRHLVNAFLHVMQRDYRSLIDDFVAMGFLRSDADREALWRDLTPIIETRFAEGMTKVKFRKMLFDFSDVCFRYPFKLPTEFTYVMRALLTLEGIALVLNPEFNFINAALPFAHKLVLKHNGVLGQALLKEIFTDGRFNHKAAVHLFKVAAGIARSH